MYKASRHSHIERGNRVLAEIHSFYSPPLQIVQSIFLAQGVPHVTKGWRSSPCKGGFDFWKPLHISQSESWWKSGVTKLNNGFFCCCLKVKVKDLFIYKFPRNFEIVLRSKCNWINFVAVTVVDIEHVWIQKKMSTLLVKGRLRTLSLWLTHCLTQPVSVSPKSPDGTRFGSLHLIFPRI